MKQEQPLAFFKGLAGYLDYILRTSPFKEISEEQIARYDSLVQKIGELEERTLKEMVKIRDEFESLVKKRKIDISKFKRFQTFEFGDTTDLFFEFDKYAQGVDY